MVELVFENAPIDMSIPEKLEFLDGFISAQETDHKIHIERLTWAFDCKAPFVVTSDEHLSEVALLA